MRRLVSLWKRHPILGSLFLLAGAATALFAIRTALFLIVWSDPDRHRQRVEPWMTPRYVGRSWDVPRADIVALLDLPADATAGRRQTLDDIAAEAGVPVETLIAKIEAYLAQRPEPRP